MTLATAVCVMHVLRACDCVACLRAVREMSNCKRNDTFRSEFPPNWQSHTTCQIASAPPMPPHWRTYRLRLAAWRTKGKALNCTCTREQQQHQHDRTCVRACINLAQHEFHVGFGVLTLTAAKAFIWSADKKKKTAAVDVPFSKKKKKQLNIGERKVRV